MSVTVSDIVVPQVFTQYTIKEIAEKSALVQSGAVTIEPILNGFLSQGGLSFTMPYFLPLPQDSDNVATDAVTDVATIHNIAGASEIAVRHSRNNVWGQAALRT